MAKADLGRGGTGGRMQQGSGSADTGKGRGGTGGTGKRHNYRRDGTGQWL